MTFEYDDGGNFGQGMLVAEMEYKATLFQISESTLHLVRQRNRSMFLPMGETETRVQRAVHQAILHDLCSVTQI